MYYLKTKNTTLSEHSMKKRRNGQNW